MRAKVVFPTPGGPQKTIEGTTSLLISWYKIFPGPIKCLCPTYSVKVVGLRRFASGSFDMFLNIACCFIIITSISL